MFGKMKLTTSSGIFKTIQNNDSYLLLFRNRKFQSFETLCQ